MIGFKKATKSSDRSRSRSTSGKEGSIKVQKGSGGSDKVRRRSSSPGTKLVDKRDGPALSVNKISLIARLSESERIATKLQLAESEIEQLKSVLE